MRARCAVPCCTDSELVRCGLGAVLQHSAKNGMRPRLSGLPKRKSTCENTTRVLTRCVWGGVSLPVRLSVRHLRLCCATVLVPLWLWAPKPGPPISAISATHVCVCRVRTRLGKLFARPDVLCSTECYSRSSRRRGWCSLVGAERRLGAKCGTGGTCWTNCGDSPAAGPFESWPAIFSARRCSGFAGTSVRPPCMLNPGAKTIHLLTMSTLKPCGALPFARMGLFAVGWIVLSDV